jgi:hypothetical protein
MDNVNIKNEDFIRLTIDLLIKNSAHLNVLQDLMILTIGAVSPQQNRDTILKGIASSLAENHKKAKDALLTEIYKQYGHIDLEGL